MVNCHINGSARYLVRAARAPTETEAHHWVELLIRDLERRNVEWLVTERCGRQRLPACSIRLWIQQEVQVLRDPDTTPDCAAAAWRRLVRKVRPN